MNNNKNELSCLYHFTSLGAHLFFVHCSRYLVILGPTAGIVTSVSQPMNAYEGGQVRGGGGGNRKMQPKTIRGNSTGMNMVSSR